MKSSTASLIEGARSKTGVGTALIRLLRDPEGAIAELKSQFTNDSMKKLLRTHIERDLQRLDQHVQAFARQLADFMQIEVLNRKGQFTFFRRSWSCRLSLPYSSKIAGFRRRAGQ
ncbi:MAG: hypothetical protein WCF26_08700 [Candidatus Sulfotelmatobacter sp.]